MVSLEDIEKLFDYCMLEDQIQFVNVEVDGEVVYQYNQGVHNLTRLDEKEFTEIKNFVESKGFEIMLAESPTGEKYDSGGTMTFVGQENAGEDVELFEEILNIVEFSISDFDDAYYEGVEQNVRVEDLS